MMQPSLIFVMLLATLLTEGLAGTATTTITPKGPSKEESKKSAKLPPCAACRMLTDTFKKGLERTSRSKFEGGDAAWEEKKMGSYKTSEVRLVEIQENLCSEVDRAQKQCQGLAEDHERLLEEWWHEGQAESLHDWLCIGKLAVCCQAHYYGPDCVPCTGGAEKPCAGHGKCKGDGTRKGNGECQCDDGYNSTLCDSCATGYYESYRDATKLLCSKCYRACNGPCSGAGPKTCAACKDGWRMDTEFGCVDVDECHAMADACTGNQFCINSEGSFSCLRCDKSCDGCDGDGPDMCDNCANSFTYDQDKGMCIDEGAVDENNETEQTEHGNNSDNGMDRKNSDGDHTTDKGDHIMDNDNNTTDKNNDSMDDCIDCREKAKNSEDNAKTRSRSNSRSPADAIISLYDEQVSSTDGKEPTHSKEEL